MKIIWETKRARLVYYSRFGYTLHVWSKYRREYRPSGKGFTHDRNKYKQSDYQ